MNPRNPTLGPNKGRTPDPFFLSPCEPNSGSCLQAESLGNARAHLICFPFLSVRPGFQCLKIIVFYILFNFFFCSLSWVGISKSSYSHMIRVKGFLLSSLNFFSNDSFSVRCRMPTIRNWNPSAHPHQHSIFLFSLLFFSVRVPYS